MKKFFILLGSNSTRNLMLLLAVGLFSFGNAQTGFGPIHMEEQ